MADTVIGNIMFVLQKKNTLNFERKANEIYVKHTLSLTEAKHSVCSSLS
ncbi:hypothetical protein HanIR_Chr01g0045641 [Helianthus annuus]|nr:hypothetical protein HanIR_Chr01g0045641 [Helianthus annuus]